MSELRGPAGAYELRPATEARYVLAEGPVWDATRDRLLWVDIERGLVLEGALDGAAVRETARHAFAETVGAVVFAADGSLLVAGRESLCVVAPDGSRTAGPRVIPGGGRRRLNDGATDPAGRFLVGSLSLDGESDHEVLARLEPDASLTVLDDDLTLSNGLAWSTDGSRLYSIDTLRRTVFVRDYDVETGRTGPREVHVELDDGYPDGAALDAEDHLWVAVWGAGEVRRYAPDGSLAGRLPVPAPHTSSVAFADRDLKTLVVTTATKELTPEQQRDHPLSGSLFTTRVDVAGVPVPAWSGITTDPKEQP